MSLTPLDLFAAWLLDAVLGDPRWVPWPHPVVVIGRAAEPVEGWLREPGDAPRVQMMKGLAFWVILVTGTGLAGWAILRLAFGLHPWLGRAVTVYLCYAVLATRDLDREARSVARALRGDRLEEARKRLARIVGRDTEHLSPSGVARGTVETVAENASDGVVAPLLYLALGSALGWGPLLGLIYKAVNTLDSTVGYRNDRYEHFGKTAARVDDLANWVPARLTVFLAAAAAHVLWRRGGPAVRVAVRDGRLHASPNSGYPEAAFAGALGVSLGGASTYRGTPRHTPRIGAPGEPPREADVRRCLHLLWAVSGVTFALAVLVL